MEKIEKNKSLFSNLKLSGLTTQIFLFAVLPISLLLIIVTFGSMSLHRDAMRALVGERDMRTVRSSSNALREQLNHRIAAIQGLALRVHDEPDLDKILDSADYLIPEFDIGMAFYSVDGKLLSGRGEVDLIINLEKEILDKIAIYIASDNPHPAFSEPIQHPVFDNYINVVIAHTGDDKTIAVGILSITNFARQTLAGTTTYEDQASVYLVDGKGFLLYHSGVMPLNNSPKDYPGVEEALHGESGTSYHMVDGVEHVVAFNPVSPTGWALVIEESWDSVASPVLLFTEAAPLVLVPIVVLALGALWLSAKQIIQPLKNLEELAVSLADGDFQAVEESVGGIDEIKSLQNTLIYLAKKIKIAQQRLRKYIGSITRGQEEERRRLARELHDETLQSLIALNQRIHLLRLSEESNNSKQSLAEIQSMIESSMQELRRLTRGLRPLYLEDLGLVAALDMLAAESSKEIGIPIQLISQGQESRLQDYVEIAIYRIVQEALNNIKKHASAEKVTIILKYRKNNVLVTITDDGKGFMVPDNPTDLSPEGHFGLLGIYERADLIEAEFEINSELGSGSQLIINIPI